MYQTSLYYHLIADSDKKRVLELFFQDWADGICNEEVTYEIVTFDGTAGGQWYETVKVNFKNTEDATVMKLRGIPQEFQQYLTLLDRE